MCVCACVHFACASVCMYRWDRQLSAPSQMDGDGDDVHRVGRHEVLVPSRWV